MKKFDLTIKLDTKDLDGAIKKYAKKLDLVYKYNDMIEAEINNNLYGDNDPLTKKEKEVLKLVKRNRDLLERL